MPARPIVIGGDDFTFLVRGDLALPFLDAWLRAFERETQQQALGGGLTACGGIAFVRRGFPFSQAHDIAEGLCKAAKGVLRSRNKSGICFARVTTSMHDPAAQGDVYDLDGVQGLLQTALQARDLPRGKLRTWVGLASESDVVSRERAELLWARTGEIAGSREGSPAQHAAWTALGSLPVVQRRKRLADALTWLQVSNGRPTLWGNA